MSDQDLRLFIGIGGVIIALVCFAFAISSSGTSAGIIYWLIGMMSLFNGIWAMKRYTDAVIP